MNIPKTKAGLLRGPMRAGVMEERSRRKPATSQMQFLPRPGHQAGREVEEAYLRLSLPPRFHLLALHLIAQIQQLAGQQGSLNNAVCEGQLCRAQNRPEKERE